MEPAVRYATKRAVYALAYAPDGERLVAGGGHWYGPGFVACLESDGRIAWVSEDAVSGKVTGVCFDAAGRHVATSAVGVSDRNAPARLYRLEESDTPLREIGAFVHRARGALGRVEDAGATGLVIFAGAMVLRRTTPFHEDTFAVVGLPAGVDALGSGDARRSSRMAVLDGAVATGFWESNVSQNGRRIGDGAGLVVLAGGETRLLPAPHRDDITAITADPDARTLTTFGGDGSIASWRRGGEAFEVASVWRTAHHPTGAACVLARGGLVVTAQGASVAGNVTTSRIEVWRGTELVCAWTLDGLLARALAAHPSRARFAVGGKTPWET